MLIRNTTVAFRKSAEPAASVPNKIEIRLRRELLVVSVLCAFSIAVSLAALNSFLKPNSETVASWFQRSGALTTAVAVFAQLKIGNFLEEIRGGIFAESWIMHKKYHRHQSILSFASVVLVIVGTLVWAYGDLFLNLLSK
jgi:hypothetical protein